VATLAKQFVWFTLAGLAGLAVDAGLFVLLTRTFLWSIAPARTVSVCCMVLTTWVLNRAVTFAQHRSPRRGAEFVRYAAVQASGLAVNIGVFALCLCSHPRCVRYRSCAGRRRGRGLCVQLRGHADVGVPRCSRALMACGRD